MDQMRIIGGQPLKGTISISGAKNAALKLMPAALLTAQPLILRNVPQLADTKTMQDLLRQHGASVERLADGTMHLEAAQITNITAPYDLVRTMRASIMVLGPLLARCGEVKVSQPGGCGIGTRPIDFHIKALEALGADIVLEEGYMHAKAPNGLKGGYYCFPKVSVTATENMLMAATLAHGDTTIANAAREPEVADLAACLVAMGAKIEGIGTDTLHVQGVSALSGADHAVVPDRIEAGTFAIAAAITRGRLFLDGARAEHLQALISILRSAGVKVDVQDTGILVSAEGVDVTGVDVITEPHPGFPTDLQAQFMALMCTAKGASMVTETIFENRFMHVAELARMGANITVHNNASALIRGVPQLTGAPVMATDLRASVCLVLAGLVAKGETTISRLYHLDRGYERLEAKLTACGAVIERVKGPASDAA
jgi:UDP-N-acetylglucosamine 1-carboxyvinyltransferase